MSEQPLRVLLALDDASLRELFAQYLHECGYAVDQAATGAELQTRINDAQGQYAVVVLDDQLRPARDCGLQSLGIALVAEIKARYSSIAFIVFAQGEINSELEALRAGVHRYIRWPLDPEGLGTLIANAAEHQRLKGVAREKQILERLLETSAALLGEHALPDVLNTICRAAFELFDVDHSGLVLFDSPYEYGRVVADYPDLGARGTIIPIRDVSVEERLIASKEPLFIPDVANEPLLGPVQDILHGHNIRSILLVPVVFKGRILGSFSLDAIGRLRDFTTEELDLCKIFAGQVAAAVENAQLFDATKRHADQLETVQQTTLAITSQLDRDILLRTIIQQAVGLLGAKSGGIYEYVPERSELSLIADYGRSQNLLGEILQVGEGMAGRLVQTGAPFMIVDDYNRWPSRARVYADGRPFGAVIEVPLKWQERTIGVLYVDDVVGRQFTPQDAELLRLFADHAAIALINAEFMAKDTAKLKRLEQFSQMSSAIMGRLDELSLDQRLQLIVAYAAEILQAESCGVLLVKRQGVLSLEASYGHQEGRFTKGRQFAISSGDHTGLTGHIAATGELFRAHGLALTNHFAVNRVDAPHPASGQCYSLLAIPLKRQRGDSEELVGLLRVDNKQGRNGAAGPEIGFTQEDEWLLRLFADAALVAIESADLVATLREREDTLTRLVDSSPNGVIAIDLDGNVTGFNVRAQEILDYQPDEVLGKPVEALYINRQEAGKVGQRLRNAPDGKLADYDSFVRSKSGERIPIRLAATQLYDAHQQPIGSVGYFEDLRSLKETEQRLELLLNVSNVVAQAENLTDGLQRLAEITVRFLNTALCRIFLLDENQQFLVAKAEHPIPRATDELEWHHRLGERTAVADWQRLARFLADAETKLIRSMSDIDDRSRLSEWAQILGLHANLQSLLIIPLKTQRRVVGILVLGEAQQWDRAPFSAEKQELATAIVDQTTVLIDRMQLHENTDRRRRLLTALDEASRHIRAEREPAKLQQTIVRLATQLLGCSVAGLYLNRPHLSEVELTAVYGLPDDLIGARQLHAQGVIGLIARIGKAMIVREGDDGLEREPIFVPYGFKTIIGVPLRQAGEVREVLFVADTTGASQLGEIDLEILDRFALQAAPALHISRLMSREQRMFSQLNTLHHISDYIQAAGDLEKVLNVVLTGITAGYGLGFNRAALLLLDERREYLIGQMGIGHLTEAEAQAAWNQHHYCGLEDFGQYLKQLEHDQLPLTPVGERIRTVRLPVRSAEMAIFWRVVSEGYYIFETGAELDRLPGSFTEAFEPGSPLVIVPLMVRDQEIGFLVADNKFTGSPITLEDIESLLTFTNTVALVIENTRLYRETKAAQERLRSFYEASNALVASQEPERVLQDTVERARQAAQASGVSVILIDELKQARHLATAGTDKPSDIIDVTRPNGLSMQVLATGEPEVIEDTSKHRDSVNPSMFWRKVAAALCLPLSLKGKRIGVMWFHYDHPRYFSKSEIEAVQLYVNQAAIVYDNARRITELEYMRQAAEALAGAAGSQEVLEQIVRSARAVLQADSAAIRSYDAVRDRFVLENSIAAGISPKLWDQIRSEAPRSGEMAYIVMERGWVGVHDIVDAHKNELLGNSMRKRLGRIGIKSFQGIALSVGDEKLGVLYVNYKRPRNFSSEERQTARTFANHAALALKKAKLLDQLANARNAARVVAEVTVLEDVHSTLRAVAEGTRNALNCHTVTVYMYDQSKDRLSHPPIMIDVWYPERAVRLVDVPQTSIVFKMVKHNQLYIVDDVASDPLFKDTRFAKDEQVASCVAIPLKVGAETVGVMFVNYRSRHRFVGDELINIELFANQAAVAIRNAQLYQQITERLDEWRVLQQIAFSLVGTLELRELLELVLAGAMRLTNTDSSSIVFWDAQTVKFGMTLTVTSNGNSELRQSRARSRGITWSIVDERGPVIIHDVRTDERVSPLVTKMGRRSLAGVPLLHYSEVIGVLYVSSSKPLQFSERQVMLLETFASQAAVAIDRSRRYEELKQTKGLVGARTALAWMGMANSTWRHSIEGHAVNIRNTITLLRKDMQAAVARPADQQSIEIKLNRIERLANQILNKPITPPLSSEEGVETVAINDLIRERIGQLWENEAYQSITPLLDLEPMSNPTVWISPEWLRRALDMLVDNAVEAMSGSAIRQLRITTRLIEDRVKIVISDTGKGIPADLFPKLFQKQIEKPHGGEGLGMGLLMVQAIVQTYSGNVEVGDTGPQGTTMVVALPVDQRDATNKG